jgi:hypothetical protein
MTIGGANCTTNAGSQTCSAHLSAPLGQDQWTVDTYASTDGTGTPLSLGVLPFTILAGVGNTASLTLNPVVNSLAFVPLSASCNAAAACTNSLILNAYDATGSTIIGATPFVNAAGSTITVTVSPNASLSPLTSGSTAARTSFNNASANTITQVSYNGMLSSSQAPTITATGGGLSATYSLTLAAGALTSAPGGNLSIGNNGSTTATLPVSEPGFPGTFTATPNSNCTGVITVGAVSNSGSPASFPINQIGAGTCSVLLSDGQGGTTSVTVTSTTFVVSVN